MVNIESFNKQCQCIYKNERYSVRDNGSIFRHSKPNKRKRPLDETWSFGKPCKHKGYMNFSSETVHRIVATAFHGTQPSDNHVVDHIDTNKKNNRPENLRWVTKLDNILLNPITLSRIIWKYGSIDNFLKNPSKPLDGELDQNFGWMRTVSKEESINTKENLINWALSGKTPKRGLLGEWIFEKTNIQINPYTPLENPKSNISNTEKFKLVELTVDDLYPDTNSSPEYTISNTPIAVQKNWITPSEFPSCPKLLNENSIKNYFKNLMKGKVFSKNQFGESIVESYELHEKEIYVLTKNESSIKNFALARVQEEDEKFVHESLGSFFTLIGAQKQFNLAMGLEWTGEDSIDDYC